MKIRAHHLLCMLYFQGKGYSEDFVGNFYKVLKALKKNPEITIANTCDAICTGCPHNTNNVCAKEKFLRKKDEHVLKTLNFEPNQKIYFTDVHKKVLHNLKELKKVCHDCEWNEFCQEIKQNFKP